MHWCKSRSRWLKLWKFSKRKISLFRNKRESSSDWRIKGKFEQQRKLLSLITSLLDKRKWIMKLVSKRNITLGTLWNSSMNCELSGRRSSKLPYRIRKRVVAFSLSLDFCCSWRIDFHFLTSALMSCCFVLFLLEALSIINVKLEKELIETIEIEKIKEKDLFTLKMH